MVGREAEGRELAGRDVNCVAWLFLLWMNAIYLNALLQIVYIALSVYGWRNWLWGGGERDALPVRFATSAERLRAAVVIVLGTLAGTQLMRLVGDAAPVWDALTTVTSIVAIYWQARKIYESWILWLSVDVVYFALYGVTGALAHGPDPGRVRNHACAIGLRDWRRSMVQAEVAA